MTQGMNMRQALSRLFGLDTDLDQDSEWSLRHRVQVLRRAILNATINPNSAEEAQLVEMVQTLKNWANLAA